MTIKFDERNMHDGPAGIRVRESKVYVTNEEAEAIAKQKPQ